MRNESSGFARGGRAGTCGRGAETSSISPSGSSFWASRVSPSTVSVRPYAALTASATRAASRSADTSRTTTCRSSDSCTHLTVRALDQIAGLAQAGPLSLAETRPDPRRRQRAGGLGGASVLILRPSLSRTGTPSLTPGARMRQRPGPTCRRTSAMVATAFAFAAVCACRSPPRAIRSSPCPMSKPAQRYWCVTGSSSARLGRVGCCTLRLAALPAGARRDRNGARLVSLSGTGTDGVLVIRVWHEAGAGDGFRARVIFGTGDDSIAETNFVIARDAAEVLDLVQTGSPQWAADEMQARASKSIGNRYVSAASHHCS